MIVKMTAAGTDRATWGDVLQCFDWPIPVFIGFIGANHEFTEIYICSKTMSESYVYDVVWCGLEMIENKQKQFYY